MFDFTRVVLVASVAGLAACTAMEQKPTPVTGGYFVFFEDRSAELTPDARAVVARVADDAAAVRPAVVRVTGSTRRAGAAAEPVRLAERRPNTTEKRRVV